MPRSPHPSSPLIQCPDDPRTLSSTCSWDTLSRVFPGAAHSFPWPQASKCCPGYPRLGFNFHFFLIRKTIVGRIVIIPQVFITSSILPTPWLPDTCRVGISSPIVSEEETGPQKGAEMARSHSPEVAEEGLEPKPSHPRALTTCRLLAGTPLQGQRLGEERRGFLVLDGAC